MGSKLFLAGARRSVLGAHQIGRFARDAAQNAIQRTLFAGLAAVSERGDRRFGALGGPGEHAAETRNGILGIEVVCHIIELDERSLGAVVEEMNVATVQTFQSRQGIW